MIINRRTVVQGLAVAGLAIALAPALSIGARAQTPSAADLAVAGPLGDVEVGSKDAKVQVIEYASLTCSHCANFHAKTWPALKSKYIG